MSIEVRLFAPLYDRVLAWAGHPHAERYLGALSFAESSFFPVPPDVMLAPMCLAQRRKAWRLATLTTLTSVAGGAAGYLIGYFLIEAIEPWLSTTHYWPAYLTARDWFDEWGVWAVLVAGFSPVPYKIFTIAAGATLVTFPGFLLASLIGRGGRFYLVAGLIVAGGERMAALLPKYVERIGWGVVALAVLLGAWLMLKG